VDGDENENEGGILREVNVFIVFCCPILIWDWEEGP
jgi:hypothetical protein